MYCSNSSDRYTSDDSSDDNNGVIQNNPKSIICRFYRNTPLGAENKKRTINVRALVGVFKQTRYNQLTRNQKFWQEIKLKIRIKKAGTIVNEVYID